MRYRKKPNIVDAIQWLGNNHIEICFKFPNELQTNNNLDEIIIKTLEGTMIVSIGDWIIRDTEGNIYPCKDVIFKNEYQEEITEDIIQDMRQNTFYDDRQLKIKVQSYPFNVRVHLSIETNFGEIRFTQDLPPSMEHRVGELIHKTYEELINELYEIHASKGGAFIGSIGTNSKEYFEKNGKTLIIKDPILSTR